MPLNFASLLLAFAVVAAILTPGYPAYIGAYAALVASIVAMLVYGWRERATFAHPTAHAILGAIGLIVATVPFDFQVRRTCSLP